MTSIEIYEWNALQGNPYLQALHPMMLLESGCHIERICTPVGRVKGLYRVLYNRAYVVAKLKHTLGPLGNVSDEQILELVRECLE